MSIFASAPTPALINIPSFSSPERPEQTQERKQSNEDESTKQPPNRPQALTREEERQMRFKNTNTKWESLGRMIEQQKASGSSSLLQLMGSSVDLSAALGGKGKEKAEEPGSKGRRKSVRGSENKPAEVSTTRKSTSPVKRKREAKTKKEREDLSKIDVRPLQRAAREEQEPAGGKVDELDTLREGGRPTKKAGGSRLNSANDSQTSALPLPLPAASTSTSLDPSTTSQPSDLTTKKPRGRVPRAAIRKATVPETRDSLPASTAAGSPDPPRLPLSSVQSGKRSDSALLQGDSETTAKELAVDGGGIKKRKKPRAIPTASAPRPRSSSPALSSTQPEGKVGDVIPDSQADEAINVGGERKGKKGKEKSESDSTPKKRRRMIEAKDTEPLNQEQKEEKRKKVIRKASLAGKATVPRGEEQVEVAPGTHTQFNVSESSKSRKPSQEKQVKKREAEAVEQPKPKKKSESEPVVTDSPPSFPVPPKALAKEKKSKPIAARQTPASPSRSSTPPVTLAPPLLSSSPTADAAASKNPKKTRQLLVRSERLETDFSVEGKVNAFDVLVGATKSVMTEAREDIEEDDEAHDKSKIDTLKMFVSNLRLPLLIRSADISEYSSLQRRLTSSKATSKKLKAEVDELKEEKKKQKK